MAGEAVIFEFRPTRMQRQARDLEGKFTSLQGHALRLHREYAISVQRHQVRELKAAIARRGRAQRGTELLEQALLDPGNMRATRDGFAVGIEKHLNSFGEVRYYWRNLETGSRVHVGRVMRGFFANPGRHVPPVPGSRAQSRLYQMGPVFGAHGRQSTIRVGGAGQMRTDEGKPFVGNRFGKGFIITIRNPIPRYRYMERGWEAFMRSERPQQRYAEHLSRMSGLQILERRP